MHRHTLFCAALTSATGSERERLLSSYLLMYNTAARVSSTVRIYCCFRGAGISFVSRQALKRSLIMKSCKCRKHLLCTGRQKRQGCEFKVSLVCKGSSRTARDTEQREPVSKSKTEKTTCCGMAVLKAIYVLLQKNKFVSKEATAFKMGLERWLSDQGHVLLL